MISYQNEFKFFTKYIKYLQNYNQNFTTYQILHIHHIMCVSYQKMHLDSQTLYKYCTMLSFFFTLNFPWRDERDGCRAPFASRPIGLLPPPRLRHHLSELYDSFRYFCPL